MNKKPLIIALIIALAVAGIVGVSIFMKKKQNKPAKPILAKAEPEEEEEEPEEEKPLMV